MNLKTYCLISYEYPPDTGFGGIGTYTWHMARALRNHEVDVTVVTYSPVKSKITDVEGIRVVRLYVKNGNLFIWYLRLTAYLISHKFNVVEDAEFRASSALYQIFFKLKSDYFHIRLHTNHKIVNYYENKFSQFQLLRTALMNYLEMLSAKKAELITAPSMAIKVMTGVMWNITDKDIQIIPNPFQIMTKIKPAAKTEKYLLFFGRIQERKGAEIMLKLIEDNILAKIKANFYLIGRDCAGFGKRLQQITNETADKTTLIEHIVERQKIYQYLANAKAIFLPSKFENFPYSLLEALYYNPQTYVLNNSGSAEIMNTLGLGGNILDENKVTQVLVQAVNGNRKSVVSQQEIRRRINDNYGYDPVVAEMTKL